MKNLLTYNQFINEGMSAYDGLASSLVKQTFMHWIKAVKSGSKETTFYYSMEDKLEFDLEATLYLDSRVKGFEVLDSTGADSDDEDEEGDFVTPYIIIDFAINPEWIPGYWQDVYMHLSDVMRHEIEHITQGGSSNYRKGKPDDDDMVMRGLIKQGHLPKHHYYLLPKEVDANLQGLRYEAKKRRISMIDSINAYLDTQELKDEEREEVINAWRIRAKQIGGIPAF